LLSCLKPRKGTETIFDGDDVFPILRQTFMPKTPQGDGNKQGIQRFDFYDIQDLSCLKPRKGTETCPRLQNV
jgi:hypothetical protein